MMERAVLAQAIMMT